jgi:hypothetical protein
MPVSCLVAPFAVLCCSALGVFARPLCAASYLSLDYTYFCIHENIDDVMQENKVCVFSSADLQRKLHA